MENVNYTAPVGTMTMPMTAPSDFGGGKTKRTDIQLLPDGPQPGVIYAVVGLGTHSESFGNQAPKDISKIYIGIEFPQLKQLFYEEDTTPRSTILSIKSAFAMSGKAKLRALAEAVIGRKFKDDNEAYNFDITQIIGAKILVNVITKTRKAPGVGQYNAVGSVMPLGGYPLPPNFNPENEKLVFGVDPEGNNFKTINYAKLQYNLKKMILASHEAKAYIAKGGAFAKIEDVNQNQGQQPQQQTQQQYQQQAQQPTPPQPAAPVQNGEPVFVLTDTQFTIEQWKHAGWTENDLVASGKGRWDQPVAAPSAPSPQGPPAPHAPQAPQTPQGPPVAQVPGQQGPVSSSWTDEEDDDLPY